jgi:Phasin protein
MLLVELGFDIRSTNSRLGGVANVKSTPPGSIACSIQTQDRRGRPIMPEYQMSKRRPARAPKQARSPKIAARAQRTKQTIVRGPKDNPPRTVAAGSIEPPELHNNPTQEALVENPSTALQDDFIQVVRDNDSEKGFDSPSATANVQAYQAKILDAQVYQAKILEMAQANMQFASEFAQKLAAIRSPLEIFSVTAEFTSKRIAMFGKYSREMFELTTRR